jgi:Tfp pilus assembly protein PilO
MAAATSQALNWRLKRLARSLDWVALAGLVLALLAIGLYFYDVRPLEARRLALNDRVGQLQARANSLPKDAKPIQPQTQLAAFYERLPDARQAPAIASRLHSYAQKAGLTLERGEYRPLADASGKFVRYQIVLPVNGTYPQLREFLGAVMLDMPELALDGINFRRVGDGAQLQAELRFTAFLRRPA